MSSKSVRKYRLTKIAEMEHRRFYSGLIHYAFTLSVAIAVGAYSFSQIETIQIGDWLTIPLVIIYANFVEYVVHRHLLHRRIPALNFLYERHAVQHHQYFTEKDISIKLSREMFYVLFPAYAIVIFIPIAAGPLSLILGYVFNETVGWLTLATACSYFVLYETLHLTNHLPKKHWIFKVPGIAALCRFHAIHHRSDQANRWNFNVTFPLADWILGTLKKK